jgi:hypothetical protein
MNKREQRSAAVAKRRELLAYRKASAPAGAALNRQRVIAEGMAAAIQRPT